MALFWCNSARITQDGAERTPTLTLVAAGRHHEEEYQQCNEPDTDRQWLDGHVSHVLNDLLEFGPRLAVRLLRIHTPQMPALSHDMNRAGMSPDTSSKRHLLSAQSLIHTTSLSILPFDTGFTHISSIRKADKPMHMRTPQLELSFATVHQVRCLTRDCVVLSCTRWGSQSSNEQPTWCQLQHLWRHVAVILAMQCLNNRLADLMVARFAQPKVQIGPILHSKFQAHLSPSHLHKHSSARNVGLVEDMIALSRRLRAKAKPGRKCKHVENRNI